MTGSGRSGGADAAMDLQARFALPGRRALVTGASRGIGRAIAIGLAAAGADIVVHYATDRAAAEATAAAVVAAGRAATMTQADLTVPGAGRALATEVLQGGGPVDIVVLCAGVTGRRPFSDITAEDIAREVQLGFGSAIEILQVLIPPMAERAWGRVVAIGSVQQVRQNPAATVYAAMKSATANLVDNLSRQYGRSGVTINNVAPGLIQTDSTTRQTSDSDTLAAALDEIPLRSVGQPDDCVGPVLLLCSEAGRYITGVTLFVDGGMHLPGRPRYIGPDGRIGRP
jgi:NAD(P)-dependent dehydrogenase (short-subunit alcohol dehydrogenase family)